MIRALLITLFFSSIFFLPWWFFVGFGVLLLSYTRDYVVVLVGALILDTLHGASISSLFELSYLYTSLFVLLIFLAIILRKQLLS